MSLANFDPAFTFAGNEVIPSEMDRYETYYVLNPSVDPVGIGTPTVGTAGQVRPLTLINAMTDYPRNLAYGMAGSAGLGGTWVVNGFNQFGSAITETAVVGTAANGGTTVGTMIFARVTTGTLTISTASVGAGTGRLGYPTAAGTVWFGLPAKIRATSDVRMITQTNNGSALATNGGTIGAQVSVPMQAFQGTIATAGSQTLMVMFNSTFVNPKNEVMAKLVAAT